MTEPHNDFQRSHRTFRSASFLARRVGILGIGLVSLACGADSVSPNPATISGTVVLQDAWGNVFADRSGVDVAVTGFSRHATTDNVGAWHLDGVPVGRHDVTFTKAAFGTMRVSGQTVSSPSTIVDDVVMGQAPWQRAVIDSIYIATQAGHDVYLVDGHLAAAAPDSAIISVTSAVMGRTSSVSADPATFLVWGSGVKAGRKATTFSIALPASSAQTNFGSGTQVFVTAFAVSACGCYTDPATQRSVYTTPGPRANVVPVTIK
jgi:hypothetical protein